MIDFNVYQHHRAVQKFPNWVIDDCRNSGSQSFKKFVDSDVADSHIVYSNLEYFKKYKGSKILLVGGGPSSKEIDWEPSNYDYVWSCNHFFKNERMSNTKIDLAMIMPEVNLESDEFIRYRDKYNPLLGFEIHDNWINYKFDNYNKYFLMHTQFYGKIGIGARMLIFAAALKCANVSFVGLDGGSYVFKGNHGFQKNKKILPSCYNNSSEEEVVKSLVNQYQQLWQYISNTYPDTKFKNIGYGKEQHKFLDD